MPVHHLVLDPAKDLAVPVVSEMGVHGDERDALAAVDRGSRGIEDAVLVERIEVVGIAWQENIDAIGGLDVAVDTHRNRIGPRSLE